MYLSDSKAFEACTVGIDAFLVASSVVSPPPVAFCLLFLSSLSFEPFGRPRFRIGIEFSLEDNGQVFGWQTADTCRRSLIFHTYTSGLNDHAIKATWLSRSCSRSSRRSNRPGRCSGRHSSCRSDCRSSRRSSCRSNRRSR